MPRPRFAAIELKERAAFWRLTAVLFLVFLSGGLLSPLLPVYTQSLGASLGEIGIIAAIYQLTSLLSQYWWGRRSDRIGRRKPLLLFGTAGLALSYLVVGLLQDWRWMLGTRVLEGFAFAAYSTGSLALIGDLLEEQQSRGRLMGMYRTFGSLAFSLAAISGGRLADIWDIRLPLLLAALCYLLAFLIVTQIRERTALQEQPDASTTAEQDKPEEHIFLDNARTRQALVPFLILTVVWTFATSAVISYWPIYMQNSGYSKTAVGSLWGLAAMGEVVCFILAGWLADLWGRKRVMVTGLAGMSIVFLGYTISTALPWLILIQLWRSFSYACFEATGLLLATELGLRRQRGRLASLYYSAGGGGGITGSLVGGAVADRVGIVEMFRTIVIIMWIGAAYGAWKMPRLRLAQQPSAVPDPSMALPVEEERAL